MPHLLGLVDLDGRVAGHGQVGQVEGQQLLRVVAEQAAERRVDLEPLAVGRDEPHPDRGVVEGGPEALAGGDDGLLGRFGGPSCRGTCPTQPITSPDVVPERRRVALDPGRPSRRGAGSGTRRPSRPRRRSPRPRRRARAPRSSGWRAAAQPAPSACVGVEPGELAPALVHVLVLAVAAGDEDPDRQSAPRGRGRRPRRTRAPRRPERASAARTWETWLVLISRRSLERRSGTATCARASARAPRGPLRSRRREPRSSAVTQRASKAVPDSACRSAIASS